MNYEDLIQNMKHQGVIFTEVLIDKEIYEIEKRYNITFPKVVKDLYQKVLPISKGFYNWRDDDVENVLNIKKIMLKPVFEIIEDTKEINWCEKWGEELNDAGKRDNFIKSMVLEAPKLIPIYYHRYMAAVECEKNPVFSIMGADVICYGKDLFNYLMTEFKMMEFKVIMNDEISYIPFWSDLL